MIDTVAAKRIYSVEQLNEFIQSCPVYIDYPLLDGDILVLDLPDNYSGTDYSLCQVLKFTPVHEEENNWVIGIKSIIDDHKKVTITMLNICCLVTDYCQLFKNPSTERYSAIQRPTFAGPIDSRAAVSMMV